jgi:hypothetical protein
MEERTDIIPISENNIEFLADLPPQSLFWRFALLQMPPGKAMAPGTTFLVRLRFSAKTVLPLISKNAMHS